MIWIVPSHSKRTGRRTLKKLVCTLLNTNFSLFIVMPWALIVVKIFVKYSC